MPFLKRTIMWTLFLAAMYFGGTAAQSSSNFLQGMGFVSMVVACVCLYIIFKLIWGPLGTFMRMVIVGGVVLFMAFSIGLFNGNTIQSFLNGSPRPMKVPEFSPEEQQKNIDELGIAMFGGNTDENTAEQATIPENTQSTASDAGAAQPTHKAGNQMPIRVSHKASGNFMDKLKFWFGNNQTDENISKTLDPMKYPEMYGHPKVYSGSVLVLNGIKIKLFGIEAPEPRQTCENKYGNSYVCGKEAIIWMQDKLNKKDVSCRILGKIQNGWTTGTCFADNGKTDVAAAIVNAGWALAYTEHTQIYVPYEQEAAAARRGLWAGRFYKPWDWRKIQNRKGEIKIKRSSGNSNWFNFKGLF